MHARYKFIYVYTIRLLNPETKIYIIH